MANLYFRYGAMGSGKSTALMQVNYNYKEKGFNTFIVKPKIDTKGNTKLVSRMGVSIEADLLIDSKDSFYNYLNIILDNIVCILVDEAQFLKEKQVKELFEIAKIYDIPVICYGLKTNFKGKLFEGSKALLELSDEFEELATVCDCGKKARFNARRVDGKFTSTGEEVIIDGTSHIEYVSLCGRCYAIKVLGNTKKCKKM